MYKEPKPIIRQHVWAELQTTLTKNITNSHIFQNCLNCMNWNHDEDLCGKYAAKPPTEIIVNSCPDYQDDGEIPF
jgi:hypothetical protein